MAFKSIIKVFTLLACLFLIGCSSDDEENNVTPRAFLEFELKEVGINSAENGIYLKWQKPINITADELTYDIYVNNIKLISNYQPLVRYN